MYRKSAKTGAEMLKSHVPRLRKQNMSEKEGINGINMRINPPFGAFHPVFPNFF